ncbi:MAG: 6,7-dimethyl-8-ribityllumazine synthase [Candidatus Omnitrophica bacterium]|nr:6,7-dimethyl-8-ribityllumazine synthase [Candidatus Omnitrophota bacterium]
MKVIEGELNAAGKRFALVVSRFNEFISKRLLEGALDCLRRHGAKEEDLAAIWVPGAFELPYLADLLAKRKKYDSIICLGTIIRGETPHFDYIATQVAKSINQISLSSGIPVIFGVITTDNLEQAIERAGTKKGNRGWSAAMSAIEMVNLFDKTQK